MFVIYAKGNISSYRLYLGSCVKITTIILLTPIPISSAADHQIGQFGLYIISIVIVQFHAIVNQLSLRFNNGWIVISLSFCHWPPQAIQSTIPHGTGVQHHKNADGHQIKICFRVIFFPISISLVQAVAYTHYPLPIWPRVFCILCTPRFGISLFMNRFRSRWPAWTGCIGEK